MVVVSVVGFEAASCGGISCVKFSLVWISSHLDMHLKKGNLSLHNEDCDTQIRHIPVCAERCSGGFEMAWAPEVLPHNTKTSTRGLQ